MGDISGGRVGIAILFLPSIICCPAERFTRGRAKGFGKVSWWGGFDRDVSFGEIFCWRQSEYVSLPSAALSQPSWSVWSVECVLEFLQSPQTWNLGGDETYDLGEKHANRTTRVTRNLFWEGEQFNEQLKDGYGWSGRLNQPRWHLNLETLSHPSISFIRSQGVACYLWNKISALLSWAGEFIFPPIWIDSTIGQLLAGSSCNGDCYWFVLNKLSRTKAMPALVCRLLTKPIKQKCHLSTDICPLSHFRWVFQFDSMLQPVFYYLTPGLNLHLPSEETLTPHPLQIVLKCLFLSSIFTFSIVAGIIPGRRF